MYTPRAPETVVLLREEFLPLYELERELKPSSVEAIHWTLNVFERWLKRKAKLADFTPATLNRFLVEYSAEGWSKHTVSTKRNTLATLWRAAYESGLTDSPPFRLRRINVPPLLPESWVQDDVRRILDATDKLPGYVDSVGVEARTYMRGWALGSWDSSFRPGDMRLLRRAEIADDGSLLWTQDKTAWPIRVRFRPETLAAIDATRPWEREHIFPLRRQALGYWWRKLCKLAGVSGPPKKIRKTRATLAEQRERGSAPAVLGHKPGSRVAYTHYVDPRVTMAEAPAPPPLLAPSAGRVRRRDRA